jgi:hypothetical protein
LPEIGEQRSQVVVCAGKAKLKHEDGRELLDQLSPDFAGRLVLAPRFLLAAKFLPQVSNALVSLGADGSAAFVVPLPPRKLLPAFQRLLQIHPLLWAQVGFGSDQLLHGVIGAGPVVRQNVQFGLFGLPLLCLGDLALRGFIGAGLLGLRATVFRPDQTVCGARDAGQQDEQDRRRGQHRGPVPPRELPHPVNRRRRAGLHLLIGQVALHVQHTPEKKPRGLVI